MNLVPSPHVRCAIYTRKSSEEGLEQAFNSLDAQREACAAYILSQASEGWSQLPEIYDDGGLSGGTLERPALQRLLTEIAARRVDTVVVYKVDRLTRSLLDFSKLVEAFDKAGTSFVSVTQSFNTTTSMGRLTLNMLLSFAQFEREVTAERIRDKIAASKAKGMWMGGTPPIGYAPDGRSLVVVEEHAALVREVFARYLVLGNVRRVVEALHAEGIRSPVRIMAKSGKSFGGVPLSRGQIYNLLKCPTYIGEIHHKGAIFAGLHLPIVERSVWDRTQALLSKNLQGKTRERAPRSSLLAGKVVDGEGKPLIAVHATKGTTRYRYYVSRALQHEPGNAGLRIPAKELEAAVCLKLAELFSDVLALAVAAGLDLVPAGITKSLRRCAEIEHALAISDHLTVREFVQLVRIYGSRIEITCSGGAIAAALKTEREANAPETVVLLLEGRLTRSGHVMRLVQDNGEQLVPEPDQLLIKLLLKARGWWAQLRTGDTNIKRLAARAGVSSAYVTRVVRLAFLSPAIVENILAGTILPGIDCAALTATDALVGCWAEQQSRIVGER